VHCVYAYIVCLVRTIMSQNPIWDFFLLKLSRMRVKLSVRRVGRTIHLVYGDRPKLQTVTGLKSHLAKQHKDVNAEYQKRAAERIGLSKKMPRRS